MEVEKAVDLPKGLAASLAERGLKLEPLAYACANITAEGELRTSHLILERERLIFAVGKFSDEMAFTGAQRKPRVLRPEDIGEIYIYPLEELQKPQLLNQIVGGLLVMELKGVETWVCRFTSDTMRERRR